MIVVLMLRNYFILQVEKREFEIYVANFLKQIKVLYTRFIVLSHNELKYYKQSIPSIDHK